MANGGLRGRPPTVRVEDNSTSPSFPCGSTGGGGGGMASFVSLVVATWSSVVAVESVGGACATSLSEDAHGGAFAGEETSGDARKEHSPSSRVRFPCTVQWASSSCCDGPSGVPLPGGIFSDSFSEPLAGGSRLARLGMRLPRTLRGKEERLTEGGGEFTGEREDGAAGSSPVQLWWHVADEDVAWVSRREG